MHLTVSHLGIATSRLFSYLFGIRQVFGSLQNSLLNIRSIPFKNVATQQT